MKVRTKDKKHVRLHIEASDSAAPINVLHRRFRFRHKSTVCSAKRQAGNMNPIKLAAHHPFVGRYKIDSVLYYEEFHESRFIPGLCAHVSENWLVLGITYTVHGKRFTHSKSVPIFPCECTIRTVCTQERQQARVQWTERPIFGVKSCCTKQSNRRDQKQCVSIVFPLNCAD